MMALATSTLWQEILDWFRAEAPHLFRAWFYDLSLAGVDRGTLVIEVNNESQQRFLEGPCQAALTRAAQAATERLVHVEYRIRASDVLIPAAPEPSLDPSFDSFVVGPENKIAHSAALAVARDPGSAYNPLVIVGPAGCGKTHLLRAIEGAASERDTEVRARYFAAAAFTADYVKSLECGMHEAFRADICDADVLLIDDVDALAWKERSLEELFHVYQAMTPAGRQLVFASSVPLDRAEGLGERLTSRLVSGLTVALEPPSLETRCLILAAAGRREEVNLPEEVTCYLAGKVESNVGELLASLRRVIAASQSKGGGVDLALAQQALGDDHSMVPIGEVLKAVSARFAVPQDRLASAKPARKSAVARDAAIYLSRRLTPMGVAEIASAFGGLTAAQVVEINRRVERERTADPAFAAVLDEIAQEAKNAS